MTKEKYLCLKFYTQDLTKDGKGTNEKKNYRSYVSQYRHNTRLEEFDDDYLVRPHLQQENIEIDHVKDNIEIIQQDIERMKKDYKKHDSLNRKMPSNTKPLMNGLITFTDTINKDIEKFGQQKLLETVKEFLIQEYGTCYSVYSHNDETTFHIHFACLNYDFNTHHTHSQILEHRLRDKENKERRNITQDNLEKFLKDKIKEFDYKRGIVKNSKEQKHINAALKETIEENELKIKEQEEQIKLLQQQQEILIPRVNELIQRGIITKELNSNIDVNIYNLGVNLLTDLINSENEDIEKFIRNFKRYHNSGKAEELQNLISKWRKGLQRRTEEKKQELNNHIQTRRK